MRRPGLESFKVKRSARNEEPKVTWRERFRRLATTASEFTGSSVAFGAAVLMLLLWGASYPIFSRMPDGFNSWQLIINSLTNIITFLMVFLIQSMQNRDAKALHLKLDEVIRAMHTARNEIMGIEKGSDESLNQIEKEFAEIRKVATDKE